jgi:peroxiredoxin Q/BCP
MPDVELKPGQAAPNFSLPTLLGKTVSLADFKGKKLLIYFYPKDDTPGCTKQACALNDNLKQLNKLSIAIVGVSKDTVASHEKFAKKFNLKFPLLSDKDGDMCESYGVWGEKTFMGKKYMGIERSSFLVGENGKLLAVKYGIKPDEQVAWALQESEK